MDEQSIPVKIEITPRGQRMIERQLAEVGPAKAPKSDARCWPHPCRDYHETYAHQSGEDPCICRCHA